MTTHIGILEAWGQQGDPEFLARPFLRAYRYISNSLPDPLRNDSAREIYKKEFIALTVEMLKKSEEFITFDHSLLDDFINKTIREMLKTDQMSREIKAQLTDDQYTRFLLVVREIADAVAMNDIDSLSSEELLPDFFVTIKQKVS